MKFTIDTDTGVKYRDAGVWRNYQLVTCGETAYECFHGATIAEIDQDGGDLDCYALEDADEKVIDAAIQIIESSCGENIDEHKRCCVCHEVRPEETFHDHNHCSRFCFEESKHDYYSERDK